MPADHCLLVPVIDDDGVHRFWRAVQGAPGRLRQLGAHHLHGPRARRLRGRRADLPGRQGPARLHRHRRHHPHVHERASACPSSGGATTWRRSAPRGSASASCCRSAREVGWDTLEQHAEAWFDYTEARMAEAIRRLPERTIDGRRPATTRSRACPRASRSRSRSRSTPTTGRIERRPARQPRLPALRAQPQPRPARSRTAMIGVFNGIADHTVPPNAGSFRRIEVADPRELRASAARAIPTAARWRPPTSPTASSNAGPARDRRDRRRLRHGRGRRRSSRRQAA